MYANQYQEIINLTAIYPNRGNNVVYPTLGLCGEAGEVADKIKKIQRDKGGRMSVEDKLAIRKELGDVLWYIAALANELGFTLSEIMEENYAKLLQRRRTNTLSGSGDNREDEL